MKKVFPAITVLILLSLLGLIYFQVLWLTTAKKTREKQLRENIYLAASDAAERLVEDNTSFLSNSRKSSTASGSKSLSESLPASVIQRYSLEEIQAIIRKSMTKHFLEKVPFEFAVSDNSLTGDQIQSTNFFKYFVDSAHNTNVAVPLEQVGRQTGSRGAREEFLVVIVPNQGAIIFKEIFWFLAGSVLFTMIITTAFFLTIRALLKQKKLSEIKSDFINNMTHEFKTPLATISLAVDALKNEKVMGDVEKTAYFTSIIKEENKRMNKQVETILQAALLDKNELQLNLKKLSVKEIINNALSNISLILKEKNGKVELAFNAVNDFIMADEIHFTNLINNLLDNSLKYSKEDHLLIKITTTNAGSQVRIKIEDNGIGMSKETLGRIFEKFYRAHTGNIHNVKGFGLGLSYVKTMVDAHKGTIKAESSLGKGSVFSIYVPVVKS